MPASNLLSWTTYRDALDGAIPGASALNRKVATTLRDSLASAGDALDGSFQSNAAYTSWHTAVLAALADVDALCVAIDSGSATSLTGAVASVRATIGARVAVCEKAAHPLAGLVTNALAQSSVTVETLDARFHAVSRDPESREARLIELIAEAGALLAVL